MRQVGTIDDKEDDYLSAPRLIRCCNFKVVFVG